MAQAVLGVRPRMRPILALLPLATALLMTFAGHDGNAHAAAPISAPVRTGPPAAPTNAVLAARGQSRPSKPMAVVKTVAAPLVPFVRSMFNQGVHYGAKPYIDSFHEEGNGVKIWRSSRPHSLGASTEVVGAKAVPEFVGNILKAANPEASRLGYQAYAQRGIKVVVDLRAEATDVDRNVATSSGLEYVNVKMFDNAIYNPMDTLVSAVNAVNRAAKQSKSVVIHCEQGVGRTGLVAAAFEATRHPEWTEADVVKYATDRGVELLGQKRALTRFWRAYLAGDIRESEEGLVIPEGRTVHLLDSYPERPGISRASLARRFNGERFNVPAPRPYRVTEPRGVLEAMSAAAAKAPSTVDQSLTDGNNILAWPLVGTSEIGKAAAELIQSAEHEVFIETMVFRDSAVVGQIRDAVQALAKVRPNVPVYVRASPRTPPFERHGAYQEDIKRLLDSPNVIAGTWDPRGEGNSVTGIVGLNVSHSKSVVVDNRRALVTDANLESNGDRQIDNPNGRNWFQTGIVFEGPAAATIREQSAKAWGNTYPRKVVVPVAPPPHDGFEDGVPILTLGQKAGAGRNNAAHQAFIAGFKAAATRAAERKATGKSPGERIMMMTPNLNDTEVFQTIADATEHVHVYLLLSKGYMNVEQELPYQGGNNDRIVPLLAKAAKNPAYLHIRWFGAPTETGEALRPAIGRGLDASHAKPILVGDTVWSGSRNLDTQSATTSRELDVVVQSRDVAAKYYRLFRSIWASSPAAFEHTPAAAQVAESDLATPP